MLALLRPSLASWLGAAAPPLSLSLHSLHTSAAAGAPSAPADATEGAAAKAGERAAAQLDDDGSAAGKRARGFEERCGGACSKAQHRLQRCSWPQHACAWCCTSQPTSNYCALACRPHACMLRSAADSGFVPSSANSSPDIEAAAAGPGPGAAGMADVLELVGAAFAGNLRRVRDAAGDLAGMANEREGAARG